MDSTPEPVAIRKFWHVLYQFKKDHKAADDPDPRIQEIMNDKSYHHAQVSKAIDQYLAQANLDNEKTRYRTFQEDVLKDALQMLEADQDMRGEIFRIWNAWLDAHHKYALVFTVKTKVKNKPTSPTVGAPTPIPGHKIHKQHGIYNHHEIDLKNFHYEEHDALRSGWEIGYFEKVAEMVVNSDDVVYGTGRNFLQHWLGKLPLSSFPFPFCPFRQSKAKKS